MLHGAQQRVFDVSFAVPSLCADRLERGTADIGIVPVFELLRQALEIVPGLGIASRGPVRSILLISKVPGAEIRTLSADTSSRTSVVLARIILAQKYNARPAITPMDPNLDAMLAASDSALVIGDPALHLDPIKLPYFVYDLGAEWTELTGLPMVFAVWAARPGILSPSMVKAFADSYAYGRDCLEEIIETEAPPRGFSADLARAYLTRHIRFELGDRDREGMSLYLRLAGEIVQSPVIASAKSC